MSVAGSVPIAIINFNEHAAFSRPDGCGFEARHKQKFFTHDILGPLVSLSLREMSHLYHIVNVTYIPDAKTRVWEQIHAILRNEFWAPKHSPRTQTDLRVLRLVKNSLNRLKMGTIDCFWNTIQIKKTRRCKRYFEPSGFCKNFVNAFLLSVNVSKFFHQSHISFLNKLLNPESAVDVSPTCYRAKALREFFCVIRLEPTLTNGEPSNHHGCCRKCVTAVIFA